MLERAIKKIMVLGIVFLFLLIQGSAVVVGVSGDLYINADCGDDPGQVQVPFANPPTAPRQRSRPPLMPLTPATQSPQQKGRILKTLPLTGSTSLLLLLTLRIGR